MGNAVKRIGIDLDNTIADFMTGAAPKLKEILGIEPTNLSDSWTIEEAFGLVKHKIDPSKCKWEQLGVDDADRARLKEIRKTLYIEHHLFRDLPPIDNNARVLTDTLHMMGYRIYFITARTPHPVIVEDTYTWLHHNRFTDYYTDLFFTPEKAKLCSMMDIPLMIEDERMQITQCLLSGINVIGRAQPWNKTVNFAGCMEEDHGKYFRVKTMEEILEVVKEIE